MRLSFKVSKYTIIFSLFVIISASYMYQLYNFIRFDLWIPKKIIYEDFEENNLKFINQLLKEDKKDDEDELEKLDIVKKNYTLNKDDEFFYLNKKINIKDKAAIWQFYLDIGKKDIIPIFIFIIFLIFGSLLLFYLIKIKIHLVRIMIACIIFGLGLLYTLSINESVSERIHLIFFGIIGFLFAKDNFNELKLWTVFYTIFWALIIATLDEIFQLYLPTRVGDIRDIIFGVLGGFWGAMIYLTLYIKIKFSLKILKKD